MCKELMLKSKAGGVSKRAWEGLLKSIVQDQAKLERSQRREAMAQAQVEAIATRSKYFPRNDDSTAEEESSDSESSSEEDLPTTPAGSRKRKYHRKGGAQKYIVERTP